MNIILFLNRDLESNVAYNLLKPELEQHNVHIFLSQAVGGKRKKVDDLLLLERYEKEYFFQIPEQLTHCGNVSAFEFFNEDFESASIEICTDVNDPAFIRQVKGRKPDLFISIRFGKIFREAMVNIPKKGILNLHSGILPDYRGILGTLHALREGRKQVGCTLHYINDHTIDTGKIIDTAYLPVNPNRTLFWHVLQLYPLGCQMIINTLEKINRNAEIQITDQDMLQGNYYSLPSVQHFDELKKRGFEVVNQRDYQEFLAQYIAPGLSIA